jgi:NAD-dependent dihydropyrimidine dehydrogenase PreA subunit
MAYVITSACIGTKDASCVDVCPVDCIYTREQDPTYYIDPDTCIDCAACESVCPVNAICYQDDVPAGEREWIDINKNFFKDVPPSERTFRPRTERAT